MTKVIKLTVWMGLALLASVLLAQTSGVAKSDNNSKMPSAMAAPEATTDSDYVIGADDVLRISVWKEPDLSEVLPVRPDGKISMPLLNDVTAAGLSPVQLKDSITEKLKKFIADPRVTVVVTQMNSQRIFVSGRSGAHRANAVAAAHDHVASAVAGGVHAVRQSESDLPAANGKWQTGEDSVQLQGSSQRRSSGAQHRAEAG